MDEVFVVNVVESIASLNVAEILMSSATLLIPSAGDVDTTVGATVSVVVVLSEVVSTVKGVTERGFPLTPVLLVTYNVQSL